MIAEAVALAVSLGASGITTEIVYRPAERAVSNWRLEALLNVDAPLRTQLFFAGLQQTASLPRCVRLNNYWCVKSARWNGEIATDNEGHVAFSSAHEGAVVAAQLLRRYYVDYGRKSAMAIVSRWAPAECAAVPVVRSRVRAAGTGSRRSATSRSRADGLTTRGIQNTARARWLAANGGRVSAGRAAARKPAVRASRVAARPLQMMRAPEIAVGMGERAPRTEPMRIAPVRLASLGVADSPRAREPAVPRIGCASEGVRIRNYAAALAKDLADGPMDDLKLFDEKGLPTPALATALANMAAVEIGPMKASSRLIAGAVDAHAAQMAERIAQSAPVELPPSPPPSGVPPQPPVSAP